MRIKTKPTKDFRPKITEEQLDQVLTRWPDRVHVEVSVSLDSGEHLLAIHLGTISRTLATRRARELVKQIERAQ